MTELVYRVDKGEGWESIFQPIIPFLPETHTKTITSPKFIDKFYTICVMYFLVANGKCNTV